MSIEIICDAIAEKIPQLKQKGYEEGFAAGQASGGGDMSAFWNAFFTSQKELAQINTFGSAGWNEQTFKPDRTINAENLGTGNANSLFARSGFEIFPECLSDGVTLALDTKGFSTMGSIFGNCTKLKRIDAVLDLKMCTNMTTAFAGSSTKPCMLESVKLKNIQKCSNWTNAFNYCHSLTDIGQESGDFGYFSASVDLSHTAIDFGTQKMALIDLLDHIVNGKNIEQSQVFLKMNPSETQTLTISTAQFEQAANYTLEHTDGALGGNNYAGLFSYIGWNLAIV